VAVLVLISYFAIPPAFCQETEDSQVFISGFNAYQQRNYASAIEKMNEVLQKYPDTPLRDMALFWLSRSYFKAGNLQEAARYLSKFSKEYPDNPLKGTVEEELLALSARYDRGEKLSAGTQPVKQPDPQAAEKAKAEKELLIAKAKAEEADSVARAAEAARITALKQAEEKAAAQKKEQERVVALKAEEERLAAAKAEEQRKLAEKAAIEAETARQAAVRAEEQKAARQRVAEENAELERQALAKEAARQASMAAESASKAALKAEEDRKNAEKAAVNAEAARQAAARAEEQKATRQRVAEENAERERQSLAKEAARQASRAAETARVAALKAEEDRKNAEKEAVNAEVARQAAARAEEQKLAQQRVAAEKIKAEKASLREKAIAQYKSIIDKYPSSAAALTAVAKLSELGVAVALPPKMPATEKLSENAQVLTLEVAQFAGFEFNLQAPPGTSKVAHRSSIPFEIINRGNGNDSFNFESGFPAAFNPIFAAASSPDVALTQTPVLAPGETFKGIVNLVIPATSIDGLRITHSLKAVSRLMPEASQSREVSLIASAPLLRAVLKTDKTQPLPGEKVVYRIAVLNVGSTVAEDVTFRINFPPQLEPVNYTTAGFKQEAKSVLVFNDMQVNSGQSREFSVTFQLKEDSLAGQELSTRAELVNNRLKTTAAFVSNMASVQPKRGILVRTDSGRIMVIPGQTIMVPFVVTNSGNVREKFIIASSVKGAQDAVIFHDINRDGIRQASEPIISEIGPLAPKEEASVVMEIKTPKAADDGSEASVLVSFSSDGEKSHSTSGLAQLVYSRPVLQMTMAGRDGRLKPGDVASFDLTITNKGSNLARVVELQSSWPEQLELVAADPANSAFSNGNIVWRFKEMGASEKRIIKVSFRVKPSTGVGTNIQVKNVMTYEDQLGNRY
jgi:uncharacterized repeat protein (TIGR01451 family)